MPEIKLRHVVSCSSEDANHRADNLLRPNAYRKWKAARPGEKQASVVLQFEKEERIHNIDVGNEGSAFVEVLAGNSSAVRDQDFEVLLVTSSFMSPAESRDGTNADRVRFFGSRHLRKSTAQEKWGRVKIVCSQPYNASIAYGVAFVKFHSPDEKDPPPAASSPSTKLSWFKVKDESPWAGPSSLQPGSLVFTLDNATKNGPTLKVSPQKLKVSPQNEELSYAAYVLQSSGGSLSSGMYSSGTSPRPPRTFEFSKDVLLSPPTPSMSKTSIPHPSSANETQTAQEATDETWLSKPEPFKAKPQRPEQAPLNHIMKGVVFVLSGFQNPLRGELRDKALAMGAVFRHDWTPDSTHLVCAFANTPKYGQVKSAGGVIVRKEWVMDCHRRKQKISDQRYSMDGAETSSESETDERSEGERRGRWPPTTQERQATPKRSPKLAVEHIGSTDVDTPGDDDDERVERRHEKAETGKHSVEEDDPYGGSTETNTDDGADVDYPVPELPDFLTGKHFVLYGKFPDDERRRLLRYIVAFGGTVEDYMNEKVQFVLTREGWHDSFEEAQMENGHLCFVKPTWIYEIDEQQKMLPYQPYSVVPT